MNYISLKGIECSRHSSPTKQITNPKNSNKYFIVCFCFSRIAYEGSSTFKRNEYDRRYNTAKYLSR